MSDPSDETLAGSAPSSTPRSGAAPGGNSTGRDNGANPLVDAFRTFISDPAHDIPEATNPVYDKLAAHFGVDPTTLPTTAIRHDQQIEQCYQKALDVFVAADGRTAETMGLRFPSISENWVMDMTFGMVLSRPTFAFVPPAFCPVHYAVMASGWGVNLPCIRQGIIVFTDDEGPGALWIRYDQHAGEKVIEVMTATIERNEALLSQLQRDAVRLSPFRGQYIEFTNSVYLMTSTPGAAIHFLERPGTVSRRELILPPALLEQIERHSLGAIASREALEANDRHLKRGLLLHGPPGTGKTHTIKYLISHMPEATIVNFSAARMFNLERLRSMIEVIVPAVIVLDDVDMIAEDRTMGSYRQPLYELLEVLDGIADDADLLFLLTTNRVNELDPAIAGRPGRVDQAIHVPLPDDCRSRLLDLYAEHIDLRLSDSERETFLERTNGVTASLIREVVRRAVVRALDLDPVTAPVVVTGEGLLAALARVLDPDNPLTPILLGAEPKHARRKVTISPVPAPAPAPSSSAASSTPSSPSSIDASQGDAATDGL